MKRSANGADSPRSDGAFVDMLDELARTEPQGAALRKGAETGAVRHEQAASGNGSGRESALEVLLNPGSRTLLLGSYASDPTGGAPGAGAARGASVELGAPGGAHPAMGSVASQGGLAEPRLDAAIRGRSEVMPGAREPLPGRPAEADLGAPGAGAPEDNPPPPDREGPSRGEGGPEDPARRLDLLVPDPGASVPPAAGIPDGTETMIWPALPPATNAASRSSDADAPIRSNPEPGAGPMRRLDHVDLDGDLPGMAALNAVPRDRGSRLGALGVFEPNSRGREAQPSLAMVGAEKVSVLAAETYFPPVTFSPVDQILHRVAEDLGEVVDPGDPGGGPMPAAEVAARRDPLSVVRILTVALEPANLGSVTIKLRLVGPSLGLEIEAEESETARLIGGGRRELIEKLRALGLSVDDVEIGDATRPRRSRDRLA